MREYQIRRLGEIRANRDKNEVREAIDRLERSAALSEEDDNNNNGVNNKNNSKDEDGKVGGRRREEISTSWGDHPQNLLRLSVETAAVRCILGEISYALQKGWRRYVPSSPVVSGLYIASFRSGRRGGGDKGGGNKRDDNNGDNNKHDDKEDKEDEEERE